MKRLFTACIIVCLLTCSAFAYTAVEEGTFTEKDFKTILGAKLVSFRTINASANDGYLFTLVRDDATRKLEWVLINPFTKKLIRKGSCPFAAYTASTVSPLADKALVFSRYPTAIWYLNLENGEWKELYRNQKGKGYNILSISPLSFPDPVWAYTVLDVRDNEGFVINTAVLAMIPNPFSMQQMVTLKDLMKLSMQAVFGGNRAPAGWKYQTDLFIFGPGKSFAYVLKSKDSAREAKYVDYLMLFSGGKAELLHKAEGRIMALDYADNPNRIVFRIIDKKGFTTKLWNDGKISHISDEKVMAAKVLNDGTIATASLKGSVLEIFMGKAGEKAKKILSLNKPHRVGFMRNGRKMILMGQKDIRLYRISK